MLLDGLYRAYPANNCDALTYNIGPILQAAINTLQEIGADPESSGTTQQLLETLAIQTEDGYVPRTDLLNITFPVIMVQPRSTQLDEYTYVRSIIEGNPQPIPSAINSFGILRATELAATERDRDNDTALLTDLFAGIRQFSVFVHIIGQVQLSELAEAGVSSVNNSVELGALYTTRRPIVAENISIGITQDVARGITTIATLLQDMPGTGIIEIIGSDPRSNEAIAPSGASLRDREGSVQQQALQETIIPVHRLNRQVFEGFESDDN